MANFAEMMEKAKARAAQAQVTWYPEDEGDNNGGRLQSVKYISLPFANRHRADGLTPSTVIEVLDDKGEPTGDVFRYNWVGTVPETTWERVNPQIGDFIWIHHHGNQTNRDKDMKDYALIITTVIDPATGEEREEGSAQPIVVDHETGEIKPKTQAELLELKPGEEKF